MVVLLKIYQFQVLDHDEQLAKWPGCETNIHWFKKSAERHGNPAQGETCDEHNNLCLCFHVRENESLAACSLQISIDLFRCPKSTYWSLFIGIIPVSFVSCHKGSTTGIFDNPLFRVLFSIESLKISKSKISDDNCLCWLNNNGLDDCEKFTVKFKWNSMSNALQLSIVYFT